MNELSNHTRNQRRMYRIHKQEEKIKEQELLIGSLQSQLQEKEKIIEDAVELINKNSNYPTYYLTGNIVKKLLSILERK